MPRFIDKIQERKWKKFLNKAKKAHPLIEKNPDAMYSLIDEFLGIPTNMQLRCYVECKYCIDRRNKV